MRINIIVNTRAKKTVILDEGPPLVVAVNAPPENNRANRALLNFLERHYNKHVRIVTGHTSKKKIVEIL